MNIHILYIYNGNVIQRAILGKHEASQVSADVLQKVREIQKTIV